MDNKVIIGLDEYLTMKKQADEIIKLGAIGKIEEEDGYWVDPIIGARKHTQKQIVISKRNLEAYVNNVLGLKGYELKIVED